MRHKMIKLLALFSAILIVSIVCILYGYNLAIEKKLQVQSSNYVQLLEREMILPKNATKLIANNINLIKKHLIHHEDQLVISDILQTIQSILEASIVYVMDSEGTVISSTTYSGDNTLVGNNYQFRPYFQEAMKGNDFVYEAVGVTTNEKGIYYSSPILGEDKNRPLGVVVIKMGLDKIDETIMGFENICALVNPKGIIFSTNKKEWLFHAGYPISQIELDEMAKDKQFANYEIKQLPILLNKHKITIGKNIFYIQKSPFSIPDWSILTLQKYNKKIPITIIVFIFFQLLIAYWIIFFWHISKYNFHEKNKEKEQMMKDLEFSNKKFVTIFESASDAVIVIKDGCIIDCNKHMTQMFLSKKEDLLGKHPKDISPDEQVNHTSSKELSQKYLQKAVEGEPQFFEWIHQKSNGDTFFTEISLNRMVIEEDLYVLAIIRDISKRKQYEEQLDKTRKRFETIIEEATYGIILIDYNQKIRKANKAALKMIGAKSEKAIIGKKCHETFCHKYGSNCPIVSSGEKVLNSSDELIGINNEIIPISKSVIPIEIDGEELFMEMFSDMREQKKTQLIQQVLYSIANAVNKTTDLNELFTSIEQSLRKIIDTSNLYIALYNSEEKTISFPFMVGEEYNTEPIPIGKTFAGYVIRSKSSFLATQDRQKLLLEKGEIEIIGKPAKVWLGVPLIVDKEIFGVIAIQDYLDENKFTEEHQHLLEIISEQISVAIYKKKMEEKLALEKAYFEQLFQASPEAIVICDNTSNVMKINKAFTRLFGYTQDEIFGKCLDHLISTKENKSEAEKITNDLAMGKVVEIESVRKRKDGNLVDVSIMGTPIIMNGGQQAVYGIYRDISEKKQAERDIHTHREHLKLINKILRHDLMNNLTVINSALKMFYRKNDEGFLKSITSSVKKSTDLISQMREMENFIASHRNLAIYDVESLFKKISLQNNKLIITMNVNGNILANDSVVSVFQNIINNAEMHAGAKHLSIKTKASDVYLYISFADDGKGIPDSIKNDIFNEEFYYGNTGNTGLGLYIVKKAMESFGGNVKVSDNRPQGTIFTLQFRNPFLKN